MERKAYKKDGVWYNSNDSRLPLVKSREQQEGEEKIVAEWLEDNFYTSCTAVKHFDTTDFQFEGVDCVVISGHTVLSIDEKAGLSYVGSTLTTFAFEVAATGKHKDNSYFFGGFLEESASKYLCVVFIDDGADEIKSKDDIRKATVVLIEKEKIIGYLWDCGWTKEKIYKKATQIMNAGKAYKGEMGEINKNGIRFNYYEGEFAEGKKERSVSVLIPRNILIAKSHTHKKVGYDE